MLSVNYTDVLREYIDVLYNMVVYIIAWARARASGRGETSSLSIDCLQQQMLLLTWRKLINNFFRRQNSRVRKRFSKIGLSCNVAVPQQNACGEFSVN